MLNDALRYQALGWSVIPLRWSGDVENRKKPQVESWDSYQQTAATEDQVRSWCSQWPQANIGVVMGEVSGLVAIDLDGPKAVDLLRSVHVAVPLTASVSTGKGFHAYYRYPGYPVSNRARLLDDGQGSAVDVRGDGGYVVAPPSVHGSGRVYRWVREPSTGIAQLPADLAALLTRKLAPERVIDGSWVDEAMRGVPEGQRDETCSRLAGYWLRLVGEQDCLRILRQWSEKCQPPFPEKDLSKTVRSVARIEGARKHAEETKGLPSIPVYEAEPWLTEVEADHGRTGIQVQVPGVGAIGGLVPGDLVTIAGRPGMGKSTWGCQLSVEAGILRKVPTLVVSTEMTRREWGAWMAAYLCKTTTEGLTRPLREAARAEWLSSPIAIVDAGTVSIQALRGMAESRLGLKLLIVDHVGRIVGGRKESRTLEVGDVARKLKSLAKDLFCTVVILCQMNRRIEGSEDRRPRLDDLRESGELEQESDSVTFLWTEERDRTRPLWPMWITLAKNRHGPTAELAAIFDRPGRKLVFDVGVQRASVEKVPF